MGRGFFKGVVLGAVVAAVVFSAAAAFAGSGIGGVFNLGTGNTVNGQTRLTGSTSSQLLYLKNGSTAGTATGLSVNGSSASAPALNASDPSGGPAASFSVKSGKAPMTVNSNTQVK